MGPGAAGLPGRWAAEHWGPGADQSRIAMVEFGLRLGGDWKHGAARAVY